MCMIIPRAANVSFLKIRMSNTEATGRKAAIEVLHSVTYFAFSLQMIKKYSNLLVVSRLYFGNAVFKCFPD
jgi:hypothetical protein